MSTKAGEVHLSLEAVVDGRIAATGAAAIASTGATEIHARVARDVPVRVELEWLYQPAMSTGNLDSESPAVLLARLDETMVFAGDGTRSIPFEGWQTEGGLDAQGGDRFDADLDGASNLQEVLDRFDPNNRNLCPDCRTDVDLIVPYVPDAAGILIDGGYDPLWNLAQFKSVDGRLAMQNLLFADVPSTPGRYEWATVHDGTFLYVLAFGETEPKEHHFDGPNLFDDDSVAIEIMPIRGSASGDDLGQDSFVRLPMLNDFGDPNVSVGGEGLRGAMFSPGGGFLDLVADGRLQVATCICNGDSDLYEFKISLDALGLVRGDVFSMFVTIVDDVNGGVADSERISDFGTRANVTALE